MTQPIAAPAWQPAARKPPLSAREKAGARLAGVIGFLMLSLGWALFAIPVAAVVFGALFALLFSTIQRASGDQGPLGVFHGLDIGAWILPLVLSSVLGLLVIVAALFVSRGILRAHGLNKPWPITLAGAGIAIAASWLLSALLSVPLQLAGAFAGDDSNASFPLVAGLVGLAFGVVCTGVIGWLAWWWMAHVMRPRERNS